MISVSTRDDPDGVRLVVEGHSDPGYEEGRLVCVSTSTLLATVLRVVNGSIETGMSGLVDIVVPKDDVELLFDWAIAWLEMLRESYPDQITIHREDSRRPA